MWGEAVLKGPSTFTDLPNRCLWGRVPAIISNSNQYELLKEKFSGSDKEIWLGIRRTSTGTLDIFRYINFTLYNILYCMI